MSEKVTVSHLSSSELLLTALPNLGPPYLKMSCLYNPSFTVQKQISVKILPCVRPGVPAPRSPRDATPSAALESVSPSGIAVASNPPDSPGDTLKRGKLISSYQWMMIETFGKSFAIICCVVTSDKMQ